MRRHDRQMNDPQTEELLRRGNWGVLSMNGAGGHPYGVPMNYAYAGAAIYLHCAREGKKLTLIRADGRVSFCVVGQAEPLPDAFSTRYSSAMVFGRICEVDDEEEKRKALAALVEKHGAGGEYIEKGRRYADEALRETVVLRIDIEHVTGKARR